LVVIAAVNVFTPPTITRMVRPEALWVERSASSVRAVDDVVARRAWILALAFLARPRAWFADAGEVFEGIVGGSRQSNAVPPGAQRPRQPA
jgi:hypothetical protein